LAKLPQFPKAQNLRLFPWFRVFADPELARTVRLLPEIGAEAERMWVEHAALQKDLAALGFPSMSAALCPCPYDYFADYLRGSKGIMLDMHRRKDKLLAAMEHLTPMLIQGAIADGTAGSCNIIFMPMHWGLDAFMSLAQFKTFYWPFLRRILLAQIEAGVAPCVFWEGDCTSRLETIGDIPQGKAIYWFERTDLLRAKEVLGDTVCLRGNVPASLLNTGTPDDVTEFCRRLIKGAGKNGGLILDGGGGDGIPDEARLENVKAMFRSVHE
jgi:uroporphyrinogen-III decarboxylase